MGVRFHSSNFDVLRVNDENRNKQKHNKLSTEEKTIQPKRNSSKEIDILSNIILANYNAAGLNNRKKIKDGHSRYEYKGARFDVYKRGDEYKSQFVHPEGFDTQEFIEKFPELESQPVIKSNTTGNSIANINGEIDEAVSQSSITGDCWLISSVVSMSKNEKGREIIKNSITVNDDNTVTVSFKGIGVSYTLDEKEIAKYDTDSKTYDSYSNGDNDMLVLELAAEKLWKDIESGKVKLDTDDENLSFSGDGGGIDSGGLPSQMIYYLTGVESKEYYYNDLRNIDEKYIYKILENAINADDTIINFGIYDNVHSCKLTDGSSFSLDVGSGGHALAVTKVTQDTVTFVNPWDTSIEYTATWEEFASLGIGYISSSDISQAQEKETVDTKEDDNSYSNYDFDWGYGYNYYSDYNYDFKPNHDYKGDYGYNKDYGNFDNKMPDFDYSYDKSDFDKKIPDNNDNKKADYGSDTSGQSFISNVINQIVELLYSLLNFLKI